MEIFRSPLTGQHKQIELTSTEVQTIVNRSKVYSNSLSNDEDEGLNTLGIEIAVAKDMLCDKYHNGVASMDTYYWNLLVPALEYRRRMAADVDEGAPTKDRFAVQAATIAGIINKISN